MPRFHDATGYLLELRTSVNEKWFTAACDMALTSNGAPLLATALHDLWDFLQGTKSYTAAAVAPPIVGVPTTPVTQSISLKQLGPFTGFKKLSPSLTVEFDKQVTLIFGKNGSGKSSICHALKVLANPEKPQEPLHNVHVRPRTNPSFTYQFRGTPALVTWNEAIGFGAQSAAIKYFDSSISIRHMTGNVEPTAAVEVAVFRLEVFEFVRSIVTQFHAYVTQRVATETSAIQTKIDGCKDEIRSKVEVNSEPFLSWSPSNFEPISQWLISLPDYDEAAAAEQSGLIQSLPELVSASSEEGLRTLRADLALLEQYENQLVTFKDDCIAADLTALQSAEASLASKRIASRELSQGIFPEGANPEGLHSLLKAASECTDLSSATHLDSSCPLCRQKLEEPAAALFRAYHAYLISNLQAEIVTFEQTLDDAKVILSQIRRFVLGNFSSCKERLPIGFLEKISEIVSAVQSALPSVTGEIVTGNAVLFSRFREIESALDVVGGLRRSLVETIKKGTDGRAALVTEIEQRQKRIGELVALKATLDVRTQINTICDEARAFAPNSRRVGAINLSARLAALTTKGKEAHNELVLGTFEQLLSDEYMALTGASLIQMGVKLASRGTQQDVIVTPKVGDEPMFRVLSEGELKIHALAVFLCEAASAPHRVLMFDDPVTSFDYNYSSNFCMRMRDLIRDHPETQVIVLTHNWHFFAEIQIVLKKFGLASRLQVQVLEDCATVMEYSEEWDRLCMEIDSILGPPGEPSAGDKEKVSGLMRRLIERVTNEFVFNGERQQFKIKSQSVSEFEKFTKVVALFPTEAAELKELFGELSPPEHDDLRNFYVGRSRLQFRNWYGRIVTVKDAVEARRP